MFIDTIIKFIQVHSMGFQLLDANNDDGLGPYRAVEGEPGKTLRNANVHVAATTNSKNNPDQFEITLKPGEAFGSAYSAINDGHVIVTQYSDHLSLSNGLTFELYRFQSVESYTPSISSRLLCTWIPSKVGRKLSSKHWMIKDWFRNLSVDY